MKLLFMFRKSSSVTSPPITEIAGKWLFTCMIINMRFKSVTVPERFSTTGKIATIIFDVFMNHFLMLMITDIVSKGFVANITSFIILVFSSIMSAELNFCADDFGADLAVVPAVNDIVESIVAVHLIELPRIALSTRRLWMRLELGRIAERCIASRTSNRRF